MTQHGTATLTLLATEPSSEPDGAGHGKHFCVAADDGSFVAWYATERQAEDACDWWENHGVRCTVGEIRW
jgi:hypothetical protein